MAFKRLTIKKKKKKTVGPKNGGSLASEPLERKSTPPQNKTPRPPSSANSTPTTEASENSFADPAPSMTNDRSSGSSPGLSIRKRRSKNRLASPAKPEQVEPTMDMIPSLIEDLASSVETSGEKPARALRMLFALSEHASHQENRINMVRDANGRLVPVLLDFLRRCERSSSEQYLALLVLNNISIPSENKRIIAIDSGGAHILSRLLCQEPSCHLMAIILVNLTFADAELRNELVDPTSSIQLVDALAFTLRLASFRHSEQNILEPLTYGDENGVFSPRKLLSNIMAEDQKKRSALSDLDYNDAQNQRCVNPPFDPTNQLFPETARWCLCAMKNLTRPSKDPVAAHAFVDAGIVPLILKMITIGGSTASAEPSSPSDLMPSDMQRQNSKGSVENAAPSFTNDPSSWDSNSIQDAALFTILNLSAISGVKNYLLEEDSVHTLSTVADYGTSHSNGRPATLTEKQQQFQCLKARMALSYLVGSEGHYGQPCVHSSSTVHDGNPDESVLLIMSSEAELLVELLANTLHQRSKDGAGGYSAATFSTKGVLFAIRCLLTNNLNQNTLANSVGEKLNCLLFKALAQHSIQRVLTIDAEAAEHACFSLYLLSNFGFKSKFLPASFSDIGDDTGHFITEVAERVLTAYLQIENTTQAGRHAAEQLLLRLQYLIFQGSTAELKKGSPSLLATDYDLSSELIRATEDVVVEKRFPGAKPRDDIFGRPILRSRAPKKGTQKAIWDNKASVSVFPSALHAVQQLSFGSTKVRHMEAIDDVAIANNIANSANGVNTESYNYWWSWQDTTKERKPMLEKSASNISAAGSAASSIKGMFTRVKSSTFSVSGNSARKEVDHDEPFSIFGMRCGQGLCAQDTSYTPIGRCGPR